MKSLKNLFFILFLVSAFIIAGCGKKEKNRKQKKLIP